MAAHAACLARLRAVRPGGPAGDRPHRRLRAAEDGVYVVSMLRDRPQPQYPTAAPAGRRLSLTPESRPWAIATNSTAPHGRCSISLYPCSPSSLTVSGDKEGGSK